jgi:hypothetical protein
VPRKTLETRDMREKIDESGMRTVSIPDSESEWANRVPSKLAREA